MKTTDLFHPILLFALFLCGLAACNNDDDLRLSPMQETTLDGDASTLQIDLTRSDWRIASITTLGGTTMSAPFLYFSSHQLLLACFSFFLISKNEKSIVIANNASLTWQLATILQAL